VLCAVLCCAVLCCAVLCCLEDIWQSLLVCYGQDRLPSCAVHMSDLDACSAHLFLPHEQQPDESYVLRR
jgi:hypothetical protein